MEGISPTLAFAALFLGLSGHPRDTVENPSDQTIITWPDDAQSRSGQTMLNFGIGYDDQTTRPAPWLEWHVWGPSRCPDVAEVGTMEGGPSGSDVEPGIEDSRHTVLNVVAEPVSRQGCR
jgi:hypothetical protein